MDFQLFTKKISEHLEKELPFVLYALPDQNTVTALLQKTDTLFHIEDLTTNGFVLAPFDFKDSACIIPEHDSEKIESEILISEPELNAIPVVENDSAQANYLGLVNKVIDTIKKRKAKKIVVSRYKEFKLNNFSHITLFNRLFSSYSSAFRYIWFHPKTGMWCGATPETLLKVDDHSFKTMALAGTQPFTNQEPVVWGPKELNEQQLVTDAITTCLQRVTSILKVSNPHTHRAGSLLHLRTDISGVLNNGKATASKIASVLHPTPAVCGCPQKVAKEFILANEGYDRKFYTGFLGPIQENGATASLMVNLRCMQIDNNTARIFVGGGITIASQPLEEWQETENKMQTMLQVLAPML